MGLFEFLFVSSMVAKTEHTHPLSAVQSTHFWAENRQRKRSISVKYRLKRWKPLEKTEHIRSPVVREVWWIPKLHRKRSIAVHIGKQDLLMSNNFRQKNGAYPFTISPWCQPAPRKRISPFWVSGYRPFSTLSYTTLKQRGGYDERSICTKSWVWRAVWGGDFHARFCERVKLPRSTRPWP